MESPEVIPSIQKIFFKDHYVLVFDLISIQEVVESCHYAEQIGEKLTLKRNFALLLVYDTQLLVLGQRII